MKNTFVIKITALRHLVGICCGLIIFSIGFWVKYPASQQGAAIVLFTSLVVGIGSYTLTNYLLRTATRENRAAAKKAGLY